MAENSGQFKEGDPRAGRPPGARNKLGLKVKEAMEQAFEDIGGAEYLKKLAWTDKPVFCALLGKMLPKDLELTGKDGQPIKIIVVTGVPEPDKDGNGSDHPA
jgi:hypothetical protein